MDKEVKNQEKVVGILGGMGPEATLELFRRILKRTPAKSDQEHLRIIIDNNPKIPDRTKAILHGGEDPLPLLKSTAQNLEKAGASFILIPCNSAHYFLGKIREAVNIPIIDMLGETVARIKEQRVGLLAADGTAKSGLYQKYCQERGIEVLNPHNSEQEIVMKLIYEIKSGEICSKGKDRLIKVADGLIKRGAKAIIVGCTELSLLLKEGDIQVTLYDPLDILAQRAVELARGSI